MRPFLPGKAPALAGLVPSARAITMAAAMATTSSATHTLRLTTLIIFILSSLIGAGERGGTPDPCNVTQVAYSRASALYIGQVAYFPGVMRLLFATIACEFVGS